MSMPQQTRPTNIMAMRRAMFSSSKLEEDIDGATMSGWVRPTTVLVMLVTASRLWRSYRFSERSFWRKRNVRLPAVKFVTEDGGHS
jgi:hypothetical protein